jgi:subfamily B ATP-binding cassette protein MsbA
MSRALAGLDRLKQLHALPTEEQEDRHRAPVRRVIGVVEFADVSYAYTPEVPVLKHISLYAPPGSVTALVGPSGSGKTTLCKLLLAFDRPTHGRVLVDGCDIATLRRREYRRYLGVVLQENFLFDGTIADNIRYGRPNASLEQVKAVSDLAHCDEFIERLEEGYDTIVGERGVRLSGGQRQRIAIARAMLADPSILILDEATSSLDSESEALIQDGLRTLQSGRTTFVIAHRLSTIQEAHQILVLEEGRIVERGTHAELMGSRLGRYRAMHERQFRIEGSTPVSPVRSIVTRNL